MGKYIIRDSVKKIKETVMRSPKTPMPKSTSSFSPKARAGG